MPRLWRSSRVGAQCAPQSQPGDVMQERMCECCGQALPIERLGVRMTALKAHLFDVIQRAGPDGIQTADLFWIVFGERKATSRKTLYAHVHQLNEALADQGWCINGGGGFFRLRRIAT